MNGNRAYMHDYYLQSSFVYLHIFTSTDMCFWVKMCKVEFNCS